MLRRSNPGWRDATRKGRRRREREAKKAKKAAAQRGKGRRADLVSPARPSRGEGLACVTMVVGEASGNSAGRKEARLGLCKSSSRGGKRTLINKVRMNSKVSMWFSILCIALEVQSILYIALVMSCCKADCLAPNALIFVML